MIELGSAVYKVDSSAILGILEILILVVYYLLPIQLLHVSWDFVATQLYS